MLILRNIIIVILLLCLAAIAVVGILVEAPPVLNWTPDRFNALGRSVLTVMRPGYLLFFTWVLILLGVMLTFFMTVARPRRRMKIEVQMGGGRVVIMDAAIKKYIRNALAEINEVTVKKIELRENRGLVTTDITADVRTRENLPVLERRIISRVRAALAEDLGITNLGDVHVYIRNFEVTGRPLTPAPAPAKQPEVSPEDRVEPIGSATPVAESSSVISSEPLAEPSPATPAAFSAATAGVVTAGALAEPIEPPGSASPIVISDIDEEKPKTEVATLGEYETSAPTEPFDKFMDREREEKLSFAGEEAAPGPLSPPRDSNEDMDEPLPWGVYKKPDLSDEDKDKDKDSTSL